MEATTPPVTQLAAAPTLRIVLWVLIFLAATEFIVRGPMRFLSTNSWNDLSQNYAASKLWLKGQSPADAKNFVTLWKQQSGSRLDLNDIRTHLAPPLGGLVIMAPVAALPWKIAKVAWLAILVISFAATVWAFASTADFHSSELRTLVFIASCFALAPFQTDIASGNISILVIALSGLAIWAAQQRRDVASGILFGMACAMKPHLAAFLVLYYLLRRRWKLFATAVACTLALNVVAALYLQIHGASWIQDYAQNAKGFVTSNPIDAFTTENPARFTLINLQVPFFSISRQSSSANLMAFTVAILLICVWIYLVVRKSGRSSELLSLATVSVIALLPVYHRFYDAALLTVPLAWSITAFCSARATSRLSLVLMTPFLLPGAAFLEQLAIRGRISETITQSWWWNTIVMPHETWSLLLLSSILLYAMSTVSTSGSSPEPTV
jgi:hypothetical protein